MAKCGVPVTGTRIQITLEDECGVPIVGDGSAQVTSDSFVSVTWTPNITDGTTYQQQNASGAYCVNTIGAPNVNWFDLTVQLCTFDVDLVNIIQGAAPIMTGSDVTGGQLHTGLVRGHFSLELWQPTGDPNACATGTGQQEWLYWTFPHASDVQIQTYTAENAPSTLTFNARTRNVYDQWDIGNPWLGDGTVDTWDDDSQAAFNFTTTPPPPAACGAFELAS